ncbi:hypothetical protein [Bradyrhizobium sp. CCGB20]|uniref:hypothetical protein n=1 Tax=Bradyrhizobium sp. CCGB20 TaxID=2949633 RepID=UPI0020B2AB85|nr:hypothetical protein [Bradyrhizobium sp. CCGB20]MCP3396220.1 hypothetical protein [Bradyrhizobium sp. CCGB20]
MPSQIRDCEQFNRQRRIDEDGNLINKNDADNSFDLMDYWNGFCAVDRSVVLGAMCALADVLKQMVTALTSKAPVTS